MTNHILNYRENASSSWKQIPIVGGGGSGNVTLEEFTKAEIEEICDFETGITEDDVVPVATDTLLGCVIVGDGLDVDADGKLRVAEDLLWENASPKSAFSGQTIKVDLSEYDKVKIEFYDGSKYHVTEECIVGHMVQCVMFTQIESTTEPLYVFTRQALTDTYKIDFSICRLRLTTSTSYLNTSIQNVCVPIRIYGIKGGVS